MQGFVVNGVICALALATACGSESPAVSGLPSAASASGSAGALGAGSSAPVVAGRAGASAVAGRGAAIAAGSGGIAGRAGSAAGVSGSAGLAAVGGKGGGASAAGSGGAGEPAVDSDAGLPEPADAGALADAGSEPEPPETCTDCCPDGFPRGTAARGAKLLAEAKPSPEGVAVCPDGEVYIARDLSGEIWHIPQGGAAPERWSVLGDRRPAGLTCDDRGRLIVAIFASQSGDPISLGPLLITGKDATPVELPQPSSGPKIAGLNGIVAVPGVGVYGSDTNSNSILLFQEDASGTWTARTLAEDISAANGLAYYPPARTLYANASGAGQLLSFHVGDDGALSDRKQVPVSGLLLFMDGVAVDADGGLYVADWLGGRVVHVPGGETVATIANPASMAFRGGTLLVTDYKLTDANTPGGLYAVALGVCGTNVAP